MPNDANNWTGSGTLVRDPEEIANGSGVQFAIAVNEAFKPKDSDEYEEYANFFDVVVWGKAAGPVKRFLVKGSKVVVEGRLKHERWEKDGKKQSRVKIHSRNIVFLPKNAGGSGSKGSSGADSAVDADGDDDIPF